MESSPDSGQRPRALHLISGLYTGGAEMTLLRLLTHPSSQKFHHRVLSLTEGGTLRPRFEAAGITVSSLDWKPGRPTPAGLWRLARMVRKSPPDLLLGWMYHANLAASFARRWACPGKPLIWNIRHTPDDLAREKKLTAAVIRFGAKLSKSVSAVVYNSQVSQVLHHQLGYRGERSEVLPNGIDLEVFQPIPEASRALKRELEIPAEALLLGRVARFDAMKGYPELLRAMEPLAARFPSLHLVLAGRGVERGQPILESGIAAAGLEGRVHLLGERSDVPQVLSALDVFCSSSLYGEGFPNVVAEAMACGVPCVVTDVGDSARVIGLQDRVVQPGRVDELVAALEALLVQVSRRPPLEEGASAAELGLEGRRRIAENFAADSVLPRHVALWLECLPGPASARNSS